MRVLITTPTGDDARARALVSRCGVEPSDLASVSMASAAQALSPPSDWDVLIVEHLRGNDLRGLLEAASAREDAIPAVVLVDELTESVATLAAELGARVCLFAHGPEPLGAALRRAERDGAELRKLRANEHVRALVNVSVSDVVFHLGVEGERFRFLEVNPMFLAATGLQAQQVVGKFVDEVIPEPSRTMVLAKYREAIAERHTVRWEETTEYPTGTKYGEVSVTPIADAGGRCTRLLGTVHDITETREHERAIRRYADIVRAIQIGLMTWFVGDPSDPRTITLLAFNPAAERTSGVTLSGRVGQALGEIFPRTKGTDIVDLVCNVARDGTERQLASYNFVDAPDRARTFSVKAFPIAERSVGLAIEDVSGEARARAMTVIEQHVLEMAASGQPLQAVLNELVLAIEQQAPPAQGSVLLMSADGLRVQLGAAPNLPEEYSRAIDGAPIGPSAGSCGTAAALRRSVIVTDIETDPLWDDYRDLARRFGLRACWSTPILAPGHEAERVIGTFALYYQEPRAPTGLDLELIARATHVAGIAIQRDQLDQQLRDLATRVEAAREEERTGIAREIHDQLGQTLTALKMDVAWIARRAKSTEGIATEALLGKLGELSTMTDEIIHEVRRISAELRPGVLDDIGLIAALSWQAQEFEKRAGIPCAFRSDMVERKYSRDVSTTVFRVFQEALTNVARHAAATHVDARLAETNGTLVLTVRDNGTSITPESIQDPRSLGLVGIRERARRLGGTATFGRVEPQGTLVTLQLPLGVPAR